MASTLRENENLGTIVTSVPQTVYTTSGTPSNTETDSNGNPTGVYTTSFGGRATVRLIFNTDMRVSSVD